MRHKPNIIIIFPYTLLKNNYQRFEIDKFEKHCNVTIINLGLFIFPKFASPLNTSRFDSANVKNIASIKALAHELEKYKNNDLIFNCVSIDHHGYKTILINYLLKKSKPKVISFLNHGLPIDIISKNKYKSLIGKLLRRILYFFIPSDYFFVAGDKYFQLINQYLPKSTQIIKGHSWEYSNSFFLSNFKKNKLAYKYAVLIDGAGPKFSDSRVISKTQYTFTEENWYPAMIKFMDQVELENGIKIVIAAHPLSKFESHPAEYGKRQVIYGQTEDLIKHCDFAITRHSTAKSFCVIYNKPLINIYSNELIKDVDFLKSVQSSSNALDTMLVNIDKSKEYNFKNIHINHKVYKNYALNFLTSGSQKKSNYEIILERCFDIK